MNGGATGGRLRADQAYVPMDGRSPRKADRFT